MAAEEGYSVFGETFRYGGNSRRIFVYYFTKVFLTCVICLSTLTWTSRGEEMVCQHGIQNLAGVTYPRGDIILQQGDPLEMYCSVNLTHPKVRGYNSSNLEFVMSKHVISEDLIHKSIINETTVRMRVDNMNASIIFVACEVHKDDKSTVQVCQNHVEVGYPPLKVEDFDCIAWNWTKLICTWKQPYNPVTTSYELGFVHKMGRQEYPVRCPLVVGSTKNGTYTCEWNKHDPPYKPNEKVYRMRMTGKNALNKSGVVWNWDFDHFAIVVPEPPKISINVLTPHTLLVNWTFKNFEHFPPGLEHEVKVCSEFGDCSQEILITNFSTSYRVHEINVPFAYTKYNVSIRMRSRTAKKMDEFWSLTARATARTLAKVPDSPPRTNVGSFEVHPAKLEFRDIYIYWENIHPSKRNGPNFRYEVVLYENGDKVVHPSEINLAYAKFVNLLDAAAYRAEIYSANDVGRSEELSTLSIPATTEAPKEPQRVSKLEYTNETFVVSWAPPPNHENIVSYTVFRCNHRRPRPHQCNGTLKWDVVRAGVANQISYHNLSHSNDEVYQFAVAANSADMSSGFVWASCTLVADQLPERLKTVQVSAKKENQISITWELDCSYQKGIIDGFTITYCHVNEDNKCDGGEQSAFTAENQTYTLKNLQPYSTYMIAVAVRTKLGDSQRSRPIYGTTEQGASDPPVVDFKDVRNTSITISIKPPKVRNGNITEYEVWCTPATSVKGSVEVRRTISVQDLQTIEYELTNLTSNTNYTVQATACNSVKCSEKSDPGYVMTGFGATNMVKPPTLNYGDGNFKISWRVPPHVGGPLSRFQVVVKQNGKTVNETRVDFKPGVTGYGQELKMLCDSNTNLTAKVRAITVLDNGEELYGDWSQDGYVACIGTTVWVTWVTAIVVLVFIIILLAFGAQKCWSCYKECSDFDPKLPPGLEKELYPCNQIPSKRKTSREDIQPFSKESMTAYPLHTKYMSSSTNLDEDHGQFLVQNGDEKNIADGHNLENGVNLTPESLQASDRKGNQEDSRFQHDTNVVPWLWKIVACDDQIKVNADKSNTLESPALIEHFENVEDCLLDSRMSPLNPLLSDRSHVVEDDDTSKSINTTTSGEPYKKLGVSSNGHAVLINGGERDEENPLATSNHHSPESSAASAAKNDYVNQRLADDFSSPSPSTSTSSSSSSSSPDKNAATSTIVPDVLTNNMNSSYVKWTQLLPDFKTDAMSNRQPTSYCQVGII